MSKSKRKAGLLGRIDELLGTTSKRRKPSRRNKRKKVSERQMRYVEILQDVEKALDFQKVDTGKWIMIAKELPPMKVVPPFMSIHWSHPWPFERDKVADYREREKSGFAWGFEPNVETCRKIEFKGESVRVFEHEFSQVSSENMNLYILGDPDSGEEPSHILRPGGLQERDLIVDVLQGDKNVLYEEALMDGATEAQAFRSASGQEIFGVLEFPPIGWYECQKKYTDYFGSVGGPLTETNHKRRAKARERMLHA